MAVTPRCTYAPHVPERKARRRVVAAAVALLLAGGAQVTFAQPAGATAVHGQAQLQQQGANLTVTTVNGAGTRHSVIDWRSFSVPGGSTTHFQQPAADSTSINRVTGANPSQIFGTLSSNGRLVLVNPAGIAVGSGAVVDTAAFTASTLGMSDADALAGRMRFSAGSGAGPLSVEGRVIARNGDVVLLATDATVGRNALVQAPQGAVIVAAGQRVELTGRGLEGIVFEVAAPTDRVINMGQLEGDAVGIFASQLQHSGLVRANTVHIQDKIYLGTLLKAKEDKDADKEEKDKGDEPEGKAASDKADKDRAEKEKAEREKADREKADKEKADKDNADKDKADKGKGGKGNGNADANTGEPAPVVWLEDDETSRTRGGGSGNPAAGNGAAGAGTAPAGGTASAPASSTSGSNGSAGSASAGSGSAGNVAGTTSGAGSTSTAPAPAPASGGTVGTAPGGSSGSGSSGASPAPGSTATSSAPAQQAAVQNVSAQSVDYQGPAVTPAQALNTDRSQDRFTTASSRRKSDEETANDTTAMGAAAQCVP